MRLSYSKIAAYRQCPQRYRLSYINRVPRPPIPHMAFARRIHGVLYGFHAMAGRREVRLEDLLQEYRLSFSHAEDPHFESSEAYRDGAEIITNYYLAHRDVRQAPALLEHKFQVDLFPVVLTGAVDRVEVTATGYQVIDYKLTRQLPPQEEVDQSLQLRIYHLALQHTQGIVPERSGFYFLRQNRYLATEVTPSQVRDTANLIRETAAEIQGDREFRPCTGSWCSGCPVQKYCPAKSASPLPVKPVDRQMALF